MAKFNEYLPVGIKVEDNKEKNSKIILFYELTQNEIDDILNRLTTGGKFPKPKPEKFIKGAFKLGKVLKVIIKNEDIDNFLDSGLKSIQSTLMHTRPNEANGILALTDEIYNKLNTISYAEQWKMAKETDASEIDLWLQYLNSINDPKTREILSLYSQIYGNTTYGHLLSLRNVMRIRSVAPDATFVLSKSKWLKLGRYVKRGAKPIMLYNVIYDKEVNPTKLDFEEAKKKLGHENSNFESLGVTVQEKIMIEAEKICAERIGAKQEHQPYAGYDISETVPYNPNGTDLLQSKPGILGNVVVKLNRLAQELESSKNLGKDIEGHDDMMEKTTRALSVVEELCAENNIVVNSNAQTPSGKLADALLEYYKPLVASKSNILKDSNLMQFAEDAVQLTLLMNNIGLDQLSRFKHSYEYTQKEAAALAPIIRRMTYQIGRAINNSISENVVNETKDDFIAKFKQALKTLGIRIVKDRNDNMGVNPEINNTEMHQDNANVEMIRENFFKVLNKLNSDIF